MALGYARPIHKRATLVNFDGSATAKTLWIPPAPITSIQASVGMTSDTSTPAGRWFGAFVLEYWDTKAAAWVEVLSLDVDLVLNTTALAIASSGSRGQLIFAPPLVMPAPFQELQPTDTAAKNFVLANVHSGAAAGETDLRLYVKSALTLPTGGILSATVTITE
jgi:hypothetical protein